MVQHTFDSLRRALKNGELVSVYYLYGPEEVLKDEAVQLILARALDPAFRDFNYDQRTASQLDPEGLHALLNTLPMMADRRVVVLRDVESLNRKAKVKAVLTAYLEKPSVNTVLILLQNGDANADPALARSAVPVEFTELQPERALRWINHYARLQGAELMPEAATHLLESVGNDLGMLRMELDKVASLSLQGPVSLDTVAALVGVRQGETLVSWRDLVMEGSVSRALSMVGSVLNQSGITGVKMVTSLGTVLIGLSVTRPHYDRGTRDRGLQQKVMNTLFKIRPYGLGDWKAESEKWARWAPAWPGQRIQLALKAALEADFALKSTRISDERGVVTDLLLQLTPNRRGEAA